MSYHCSVHDPQASHFWGSHRAQKVSLSEWHGWSLASGHHTVKDTTSPRVHYGEKIKQSKILLGSPVSKRKFYHKHRLFCGKDFWKDGEKTSVIEDFRQDCLRHKPTVSYKVGKVFVLKDVAYQLLKHGVTAFK